MKNRATREESVCLGFRNITGDYIAVESKIEYAKLDISPKAAQPSIFRNMTEKVGDVGNLGMSL